MPRSVPEWVGKSPDQKVPDRVRLRIFEREGGRCHVSGRKIMPGEPWELDHKIALINGGEHRESNLFPALRDKHRAKTAQDVAEKAVSAHKRKKHLGISKSRHRLSHPRLKRRMDGTVVDRQTGEPV